MPVLLKGGGARQQPNAHCSAGGGVPKLLLNLGTHAFTLGECTFNGVMQNMPMTLLLDCWEEGLSMTQLKFQEKANSEMSEFERKISEVYDMVGNYSQSFNAAAPTTPTTSSQLILPNAQQTPHLNGSYVVVEPNNQLKLVVQPVPAVSQTGQIVPTNSTPVRLPSTVGLDEFNGMVDISVGRCNVTSISSGTGRKILFKPGPRFAPTQVVSARSYSPLVRPANMPVQIAGQKSTLVQASSSPISIAPTTVQTAATPPVHIIPKITQTQVQAAPAGRDLQILGLQNNAVPPWNRPVKKRISNTDVVDLTSEDVTGDESSHIGGILPEDENLSRDETEKTFPSLVVVARAFISTKSISTANENLARSRLDSKVKQVLVLGPTALTEYLLQQQLIKSKQTCRTHNTPCKLGMYSEASKLPNSGGYVWVSECCPDVLTSVFAGSIFEGAPHPPTLILKLIYHWACQTSVQNVLHWVKVSNIYVKKMYTFLRSVCVAVVHQHFPILGGPGKIVEVGLISLGTGTTSGKNILKRVKVEVLGIYDQTKRWIRLKALDPIPDTEAYKRKKFLRCLQTLKQYIDKDSIIVTDICADDPAWQSVGFTHVEQSKQTGLSNKNVMNYIRNIIPRMFQNTLSLLSRQLIQQFFDELVWREAWGFVSCKAYARIIRDIVELTRLETDIPLVKILVKIATNPFKNWQYDKWVVNCSSLQDSNLALQSTTSLNIDSPFMDYTVNDPEIQTETLQMTNAERVGNNVYLESYYYGSYEGENISKSNPLYMECTLCFKDFRDNAQFSDHLILHALNKNFPKCETYKDVCRICLKVPNISMNAHVNANHKEPMNQLRSCKICNIQFKQEYMLISHMTSKHNELELPYTCEICYFRTSIFEDIQNHFSVAHKNISCAQCPFCLKIVNLVNGLGEDLLHNQLYFIKHIQRHQLPFRRKCDRCALSFTSSAILKDHIEKKHTACKTFQGITRYKVSSGKGILMSVPSTQVPITFPPVDDYKSYKYQFQIPDDFSDNLTFDENLTFLLCQECDGPLSSKHFTREPMVCKICQKYKTHCSYALCEHELIWHVKDTSNGVDYSWFEKGSFSSPSMQKPLHCTQCLYTSTDGNEMATHIMTSCPTAFCTKDKRKAQLKTGSDFIPESVNKRKRKKKTPLTLRKRRKTQPSLCSDESSDDSTIDSIKSSNSSQDT
ncbi:uncharacterized protein LOC106661550 isoform X2 [Cimex lectularius]|uniref:C2H2-type domain-containing protein n=1 Tax=Cimex lectularius TaxID=79782 RepID=A0A8I6RB36_CIMLE|nr:uncharacterized protein LOC106661550 isoform X2 [Cimex lectularius]